MKSSVSCDLNSAAAAVRRALYYTWLYFARLDFRYCGVGYLLRNKQAIDNVRENNALSGSVLPH